MEHKFHTKMSSSNGGTLKKSKCDRQPRIYQLNLYVLYKMQEFPSIITVFTDQQNFVFVVLGL